MLNLEESKYALSKILEVLMSPWQSGINYDNLKAAADRHNKRIHELEAAQHKPAADGFERSPNCTCDTRPHAPWCVDSRTAAKA